MCNRSSIVGSLDSEESNNWLFLEQILPSETGEADSPIIKWVRQTLQLSNGFVLKFLLQGSLTLAVKAVLFGFK